MMLPRHILACLSVCKRVLYLLKQIIIVCLSVIQLHFLWQIQCRCVTCISASNIMLLETNKGNAIQAALPQIYMRFKSNVFLLVHQTCIIMEQNAFLVV